MTSDTYAEERMLGFTRTLDASPARSGGAGQSQNF